MLWYVSREEEFFLGTVTLGLLSLFIFGLKGAIQINRLDLTPGLSCSMASHQSVSVVMCPDKILHWSLQIFEYNTLTYSFVSHSCPFYLIAESLRSPTLKEWNVEWRESSCGWKSTSLQKKTRASTQLTSASEKAASGEFSTSPDKVRTSKASSLYHRLWRPFYLLTLNSIFKSWLARIVLFCSKHVCVLVVLKSFI